MMGRSGAAVTRIVREEGFAVNSAKTRVMPRHACQRVTGVAVNEHCNTGRTEFEGRIAWVEQVNSLRGTKLRAVFDRIDWGG
jgi:hypothetical protein